MKTVKMYFQNSLRIGAPGWGLEEVDRFLGADLIYNALTLSSLSLYGETLPQGLRLSSGFPFYGRHYYFPKPRLYLSLLKDRSISLKYGKDLKNLMLLVEEAFREWLRDGDVDIEKAIAVEKDLAEKVKSILRPRVSIDRVDNASGLYFSAEYRFSPGTGLFIIVDCMESYWERLKTLFRFLGDTGIGGEKSSGQGQFEVEFDEIAIPRPREDEHCINLSPVIPERKDCCFLEEYDLKSLGGWTTGDAEESSLKKKRVFAVSEGSLFARPVEGQIADVTPANWPHQVLRYGLGLYAAVR